MSRTPIKVIHVGPHPMTVGGTQSVIRTIADFGIGADSIGIRPTWSGSQQFANARLVRRAAGTIARVDRRTIVHVHLANGGAYFRDGPLIALARKRGLRVVVTIHGFDFPEYAAGHRKLVQAILGHAHGILCLSDEAMLALQSLKVSARLRRLANPVVVDREAPPVQSTEPVALFAGTIGTRKGVDVLVEAWRLLLDRNTTASCRLVGPIDDYVPPEMDRLSIEDPVEPRLVRSLIRTARVVVLPSRAEGMPMILTEALAAGRPFVTTRVGGSEDLAPCQDMLVDVEDPVALAGAMARFLDDAGFAQQVGTRCRQFCERTRSPEVIDTELRAFYEAVLN